jgi:hypothetical protein
MKLEDRLNDLEQAATDIDDQLQPEWEELPDELRLSAPKHLLMYAMRKRNGVAKRAVS